LLICESISFFTVGSVSSFFFFLVTDMLHMKSLLSGHLWILFRLSWILIWRSS
jgi:hypothetical protein